MKILIRNSVAFLLVFTMIFTLGVSTFAEGLDSSNGPTGISNGDDKTVTDDETTPPIENLEYIVKYYFTTLDGEEIVGEVKGEVSSDNPVITVEDVPVPEDLPEGYVIDEELSTLSLEVSEENNVIEVHYVPKEPEVALAATAMPTAVGGLQDNYIATTDVFDLRDLKSTNSHTRIFYAWYNGQNLFLAIGLDTGNHVTDIKLEGNTVSLVDVHQGTDAQRIINVNNDKYAIVYDSVFKENPTKVWNVVNLGPQTLTAKFNIEVQTTLGEGHWLITSMEIIDANLEVYHDYEGVKISDEDQSGILIYDNVLGKFIYSVHPEREYSGEVYNLIKIDVEHNGIKIVDVPDLDDNDNLNGIVTPISEEGKIYGRAKITFIYEKVRPKGSITITKLVQDYDDKDVGKVFDIFIFGPVGNESKKYTLTLEHEGIGKIEGLPLGTYEIKEIVPMNYNRTDANNSIIISNQELYPSATITNKRTNDGWFYDDDEVINSFLGIGVSQEAILPERIVLKDELELEEYV